MMIKRTTAALTCLLALSAIRAAAQAPTADHSFQDARIHESLITTTAGGLTLSIHNLSSEAITACVFREVMPEVNGRRTGESAYFADRIYSPHPSPRQLALNPGPNETGSFVVIPDRISGRVTRPAEVSLMAVVFEDGSSAGDPTWISAIIERRKAHLQALSYAASLFQAAQAGSESMDQVLSALDAQQARLGPSPSIGQKPVEWGRWAAQAEIYREVPRTIRSIPSSDRVKSLVNALLTDYSSSIQRIENSKPSLSSQ
ncbi:MAG TPA: hypothetical protein VN661_01395 [Candidatus Acidoferrales bacterium]|nr:hypothetical protein [Candidatus Acidoferrales bacterium]